MFGRILFWLLLPVTAVQGLWLRNRALRLPGARGERRGACGCGEVLNLLAVGDSIIDGVGTESMKQALPVLLAQALAREMQTRIDWFVEGESGLDIAGLPPLSRFMPDLGGGSGPQSRTDLT